DEAGTEELISRCDVWAEISDSKELISIWHYSRYRRPTRGGHRMISPRSIVLTTVSVNELIPTALLKKYSNTAPSRNPPLPSKAASSSVTVSCTPRPNTTGPGSGIRRITGADTTDLIP